MTRHLSTKPMVGDSSVQAARRSRTRRGSTTSKPGRRRWMNDGQMGEEAWEAMAAHQKRKP
jgi:hypothetical protein